MSRVVLRPEDLERLLRGTVLQDRWVLDLDEAESGEAVLGVDVRSADEVLDAWRTVERLLPLTRRWPIIAGMVDVSAQPLFDLSTLPSTDRSESARLALRVFAEHEKAKAHADDEIEGRTRTYRDFLTFHIGNTEHRCGEAPSEAEITGALPDSASEVALDRWLMNWEEQRQPTTGQEGGGHLGWFFASDGPQLILTLAPSGPLTLAYTGFWGFEPTTEYGFGHSLAGLIAVLRYWEDRYGAKLVANWGTVLQFVVERPPESLDAAWDLARQQHLIAPDTFARAGLATRAHARALLDRRDWLLHSRP